jgi:hypothetical protein
MAAINNDWLDALKGEFRKPYYRELFEKVNEEYRKFQIFPPADDIFNAFQRVDEEKNRYIEGTFIKGKGGNFGTGSLSQCGAGTWFVFFSEERGGNSSFAGKYL